MEEIEHGNKKQARCPFFLIEGDGESGQNRLAFPSRVPFSSRICHRTNTEKESY